MTTFSDDFERPDGGLGNNWLVASGSANIVSGKATFGVTTRIWRNDVSAAERHEVIGTVPIAVASDLQQGPMLKWVGSAASGYVLRGSGTLAAPVWTIYSCTNTALTGLASVAGQALSVGNHVMRMVYDGGRLIVWIDGYYIAQAYNTTYASSVYFGWWGSASGTALDSVLFVGDEQPSFSVSPIVVGNYGNSTDLTFTGVGTTWTPGTPGSPVFTVNHGVLTNQLVVASNSAAATYTPGNFLGTATFSDPSTGASCDVVVTSDPNIIPVAGECLLDQDGADLVNFTADHTSGDLLTTDTQILTSGETQDLDEVVSQLWRGLFGGDAPVPPTTMVGDQLVALRNTLAGGWEAPAFIYTPVEDQPIKYDTEQSRLLLTTLTTSYDDLADVVTDLVGNLGGAPTSYSNADLKDAIDNIDLSSILTRLDEIQPNHLISITDLAGLINNLTAGGAYDLAAILTAISNLNPATAPGLAAATASILGSIGAIALEIVALSAAETEDAAASTAGAASAASVLAAIPAIISDLASILSDLADLKATVGAQAYHPPVWPGVAHVSLGAPQSIQNSLVVVGPMHGVILDITTTDPGTGHYDYDVDRCYRNIGGLSFVSDRGDHEHWQPLGFSRAVYVPRTMTYAASCKLHLGRGPVGTITPWSYAT